jgi:hypothetical protein
MNMISTGAFQTEMNASSEHETITTKFVRAWEKKNAKAARAGGLSLMALSLAACGSSDDDVAVVTPVVPVTPVPVTPVVPVTPAAHELTTQAAEAIILTSGQDASGLVHATAVKTTLNASDEISSVVGSGATFTMTDASGADMTAAITGDVRNFDNIIYNIDALAVNGSAQTEIALTDFAKAKTYTFDNTYAGSIVDDLVLTGTTADAKVTTSSDFTALKITPTVNSSNVEVDMSAAANTLVVVSVGANVIANATGTLGTTATTTTGLVQLTSTGNNTVTDATAAASLIATSTAGAVTVTDANNALLVNVNAAKGVTLTDVALVTNLDVVASGGNVSVTNTGAGDANLSASGTITMAGTINSTTGTFTSAGASTLKGDALATVTVSGNGAAADYTMSAADHAGLAKIVVEGSQDVTVAVVGSEIAGALVIDDNSTGTFRLDVEGGAGVVTLSGDAVDDLNITNNFAANALTVVSGQNVDFAIDQASASNLVVGAAASAASNTVTLDLDDGSISNSAAVDLAALTVTQAKTVTVNAGLDANTAGTASNLTSFAASAVGANTTLNLGANGGTLTTGATSGAATGYGTLTITGSGALTIAGDGSNDFTANAATIDASAMTAAVTMAATDELIGAVTTVKTGSGNDAITPGVATISRFELGAGNDTINLDGIDYGTTTTVIDFGTGSDTLSFGVAASKLSDLAAGSSVSGLENITFHTSAANLEIDANILSGQTFAVKASATGSTNSVAAIVQTTDTSIDMSTLVNSADVSSSMAAVTYVTNASGNSSAITIKGANGAKNTITAGASGGDSITGGDKVDSFVVTSDGVMFNASNVMLDTFVGGAGADTYTIGTNTVAFTIVAADNFSKSTTVEGITAVANTAAYSLTLGASAETAGIVTVNLSSAGTAGTTTSLAAYTTSGATITGSAGIDTITGGAGADTITGGLLADVISGGNGDDVFVYKTDVALHTIGGTSLVDTSIAGGAGSDTLKIGTTGTAYTLAGDDVFTAVTSVEKMVAVANTSAVSLTADATAHTAGIRTFDVSAGTAATGNVINVSEYTGIYEADGMVLKGSTTGVTTITGGAGDDVITGGSAADNITGGAGGDTIDVGSSVGADIVNITAANQTGEYTSTYAGTSVATTGMDIISGLNSGDDILLSTLYTTNSATAVNTAVLDSDAITKAADLSVSVTSNTIHVVRGTYITNVFSESATGADAIVLFDADADKTGVDIEAFVIVGGGAFTYTIDAAAAANLSIA